MKVLWFTNTASLASGILNLPVIGGGWIESLEKNIRNIDNIELAVAFRHGEKELNKFADGKAIYYAIPKKRKSKIKEVIDRHLHTSDNGDLINYCIEIINEFKPDIINIFGTENGFGLISSRTKIPVVIHLQGILTVYEKKWFSSGITMRTLLRYTGLKHFLKGGGLFHDYRNFQKAAMREKEIFRLNQYFLGRTDWDRRITSILSPEAKYYFSNEILRSEFYSAIWTKKERDTKVLISTIQGNIYKGLETVFECAKYLTELTKINFKWIIAGISKEDIVVKMFQKKLHKKIDEYNIVLNGRTSSKNLIELESEADIFIHPSHIDNSPNSVCEAMLLGMPIIATCTGGTSSLLIDGKEGLFIQDGDPYSMAGAILELINNPGNAAELGRNARKRALIRHQQDDIVKNLINIYTDIINNHRVKKTS